jgi:Transposase domain (DUF772)
MRGLDAMSGSLFSYVDIEARIPTAHPIRIIGRIVNEVLADLDAEFAAMYSGIGRPSIAPEKLLRGSLLQIIFSVRSERQLMEQLDYNRAESCTGRGSALGPPRTLVRQVPLSAWARHNLRRLIG